MHRYKTGLAQDSPSNPFTDRVYIRCIYNFRLSNQLDVTGGARFKKGRDALLGRKRSMGAAVKNRAEKNSTRIKEPATSVLKKR